jgi:hypothetical protein
MTRADLEFASACTAAEGWRTQTREEFEAFYEHASEVCWPKMNEKEWMSLILDEVRAPRNLEEIIYNSRRADRKRVTCLHRPLRLEEID